MRYKTLTLCFVLFLFFGGNPLLNAQMEVSQMKTGYLFGEAKEGWMLFNKKKCIDCHSIWGEGGKGGPDLGPLPRYYFSQSQLAALIWDHDPEMWGGMIARKTPFPTIDKKEMTDLFAFLNFIRYMDEPGNAEKGKNLMKVKACDECHTVQEGAKGDLGRWGRFTNPILWAQMMWNHTPQMEQEMRKKGIPWVEFKGNEMIDLIGYIRSITPAVEKKYLSPGDSINGEKLFIQKGCIQCHRPNSQLDLSQRKDFPPTVAQLAGEMWNHSKEMWRGTLEKGIKEFSLSPQEMADIIAYLFSVRYMDEPGVAGLGKTVFIQKQCNLCHIRGEKALDLSRLKGQVSVISITTAIWNHGPQMLEQIRKAKMSWQKISGRELIDLMAYLNGGVF
jgi:cytochrome c2